MKTSNKLLLGLIIVLLIGIIVINIVYKTKRDYIRKNYLEVVSTNDSVSSVQDSLAMENAMNNQ